MKHPKQLVTVLLMGAACTMQAQRSEALLEKNWKFSKGDFKEASQPEFNDTKWESVVIPHDWAIFGPFDMNNDLQNVAVTQNFEKKASLKTGRTGGLPYVGTGWYRTSFDAPADKEVTLLFDGAMSEARVYINGKEACFWPFGYNSFHCNVTSLLNKDGKNNTLAVRLENRPQSSRWYPGAGLYRNVHLIVTDKIHVPVWGTQITTPHVNKDFAAVRLQTKIDNAGEKTAIRVETEILSPEGKVVTRKENTSRINHGQPFEQNFIVNAPELWSPESPSLYKAVSKIYADDKLVDTYTTRFGIRSIEYIADKGFYLNGKHRKFQGVCNHHDLGPLGAAINVAALRHQLTLLKDMGCDAIRTSHNMPTPELVALCDEMGFMMMIEPFDEWDIAKCENGYHRYFDEWAERDMINMLHNYRNNPCVIMWSIGNEVPTQCSPVGYKVAKYEDHQCSSYDVEVCPWSNIPDEDFALADDHHWTIGQFVWTGFDYLGEPSPYDTDSWPNHSSMFGIIDLASLPKDRYYLYRSVWNKEAETLHILPHWTWPGREGEVTPIFVYTNYPTAELFINGKSYGKQSKNNSSLKNRYRLMWMDTKYEPGEVKVVAYDKNGKAVAEKVVRTAGKPHHIELVSNRNELTADGKDLAYVTVKVVDKDGNLCPTDNRQINFSVKGTGKYRAAANGDPTNLEQFHLPKMHAFNGMLTAILQAGETAGEIVFTAKANGVKAGNIRIQTK